MRDQALGSVKLIDARPDLRCRDEPGHWEGDLLVGAQNRSAVVTLIERTTRYAILGRITDRHSARHVAAAVIGTLERCRLAPSQPDLGPRP